MSGIQTAARLRSVTDADPTSPSLSCGRKPGSSAEKDDTPQPANG